VAVRLGIIRPGDDRRAAALLFRQGMRDGRRRPLTCTDTHSSQMKVPGLPANHSAVSFKETESSKMPNGCNFFFLILLTVILHFYSPGQPVN
jgi:hypothetical protein